MVLHVLARSDVPEDLQQFGDNVALQQRVPLNGLSHKHQNILSCSVVTVRQEVQELTSGREGRGGEERRGEGKGAKGRGRREGVNKQTKGGCAYTYQRDHSRSHD